MTVLMRATPGTTVRDVRVDARVAVIVAQLRAREHHHQGEAAACTS
jgi:hypothetical protein